jgi:hypothetical protein
MAQMQREFSQMVPDPSTRRLKRRRSLKNYWQCVFAIDSMRPSGLARSAERFAYIGVLIRVIGGYFFLHNRKHST